MTITEVSKRYELTPDTLRYYERVGLIPSVNRSKGGVRDYMEEDCKWVGFIKCMRGAGLPIEVLIKYVRLFEQGDATIEKRKELLVEQRRILLSKMEEIRASIERLEDKIERYDHTIAAKEKELLNAKREYTGGTQ